MLSKGEFQEGFHVFSQRAAKNVSYEVVPVLFLWTEDARQVHMGFLGLDATRRFQGQFRFLRSGCNE